jgi:murein DD-endopeptidase MepM/ murein hydrolase activator NlpD
MPNVRIGQRVNRGDPLGPTGKSGVPSKRRPDHLHVRIVYSTSDKYAATSIQIIPAEGHYADVVALMRRRMPLDTNAMRAVKKTARRVTIPYRLTSGETVPPDTKIIWPYACNSK